MAVNISAYKELNTALDKQGVTLVAVSKTKPVEDIMELYNAGHRDFGENYVQELADKYQQLPKDIRWHFIGHLQRNKVKYITPFVHLIHGVDSFNLLEEINKQGLKKNRVVNCLLQIHIAEEETKFGLNEMELENAIKAIQIDGALKNIKTCGFMGMASFSKDMELVKNEFNYLKSLFDKNAHTQTTNFNLQNLSMGMSSDYTIAIEEGSNMVRIGSLLFGDRNYTVK